MRRVLLVFLAVCCGLFPLSYRLHALTDEEKREAFLKSRGDGEDATPTPTPKKKASPSPTPRSAHKATPTPEETPKSKAKKSSTTEETPKPKAKKNAEPEATPRRKKHPGDEPTPEHKKEKTTEPSPTPSPTPPEREEDREQSHAKPFVTPVPTSTPTPVPTPTPQPTPKPSPTPAPAAPVTIEKSGFEEQTGLEPAPPAPTRKHWWQVFGGSTDTRQYHYLTRAIRDAIDRAPVQRRRWRYIVVHNSGTRQGNAKIFDYYHLHVRKMPNGLAYHFVIGNGTSSGNGQIEIGNRWTRQINGGHVHSDYLNNIALGICLVGDFNRDVPTRPQLEALEELIDYLRQRVGKIDRKEAIVKAHREINPPQWPTDCPGDRFPYSWLHRRFD